jgi:uncharacterized protein YraI
MECLTLGPADTLNVRSGPGTNYPQQAQVRAERDWLHVRIPDGSEGWVAARLTDSGTTPAASLLFPSLCAAFAHGGG